MQYTLFPFGNSAAATSGVGYGLCAKRDANIDVEPPTFALSQPVVRAITVTAEAPAGAHGVDVGFTE